MNILEYKNNLKSVKKQDLLKVIKDHRNFIEGANDNLRLLQSEGIPLSQAMQGWKNAPLLFKAMRGKTPNSISMEAIVNAAIVNITKLLDALEKDFSAGSNVIGKETATIRELNGLLLDSYIGFWADYLARLMNMFTSMMVKGKTAEQVTQKPDLEFLNNEMARFGELTDLFFERGGIIIKRYNASPKLLADDQTVDVLEQTKGKDAVLVMTTRNFGPHSLNPGYWWGMFQMELALTNYEKQQNSIEANAQKISYYQDLQHKAPSPANEQMIAKLEERIIKSQARMEEIEARYA
ncbi:hypothetical protein [Vibrio phage phiKT1028]|nr:hypothetical protein [Vibrio phage phiKT1028]